MTPNLTIMNVSRVLQGVKTAAFTSNARQKLLVFASLLGLLLFFSMASPSFMQTDNRVGILQATAVNGYDAGKQQKAAILGGSMAGAVIRNPLGIGYKTAEAAVKSNIDDPKIAAALYD